ncbi:transaldolase [Candidatus Saganbacteria bacterium]|uniref:Transaldolase n=1 Tax=Candidatus Saganbacteria bacterium TaxID=2575572 RepID=A0A9D6YT71_UNCSA|nr:transaldolase [Candidatus Saganbacteria bacterium]
MSRLKELHKFGQSPWYDNIERGLLLSGRFKKMLEEDGITGVTTNPSIFEKAITGSADYDSEIGELGREGRNAIEIYDELTTRDVLQAADILNAVYSSSNGSDGFVSIEVSPHLAHDAAATVSEAKRLFNKIGRANVMIKVPATEEGIKAIKALIADGINVNATLIFSKAHYEGVAQAYIEGLEERSRQEKKVEGVASVASFFVSRIDTQVDKMLKVGELKGKAAVAQAKAVYEIYKRKFSGPEWNKLERAGAKVQRLLFGSTSAKNPAYRDVKYVEEIIGEGTINTLPEATVEAFRRHGVAKATLGEGIENARRHLLILEELGINVEAVGRQLQDEGIKAFIDAYDKLILMLEAKKNSFSVS